MTTYTIQGPSGRSYTIEGPEGATADQLGQAVLAQSHDERVAATTAQMRAEYNPTNGMGTGERFTAAMGRAAASVGRGLGQVVGLTSSDDVAEARRLDAPLLNTTAGKWGNAVGTGMTLAPVAMIPGVNTVVGATAAGGIAGGLTTEGGLGDRALGAAGGAVGGGVGRLVGQGLSAGAGMVKNALTKNAVAAAPKQAAVQAANDAGYVLPPNEINPDLKNALMQAWAGPRKTTQVAAAKNQEVTNALAAKAVGLPENTPITQEALGQVRQEAGKAYEAVANTGTIKPGASYDAALDKIVAPFQTAAKGFPNAKPNPVIAEIESLRSPEFDAGAAVAKIKELRAGADAAYASGNKELGKALKDGAGALEGAIDEHLQAIGAPSQTLNAFRDARTTIAKTYDVQKALKGDNVSGPTLAATQARTNRLTGELGQIADAAGRFPKSLALVREAPSAYSAVDAGFGLGGLTTGNPLAAAAIAARPAVRAALLSGPGQKFAAVRTGAAVTNALADAGRRQELQNALTAAGIAQGSRALVSP